MLSAFVNLSFPALAHRYHAPVDCRICPSFNYNAGTPVPVLVIIMLPAPVNLSFHALAHRYQMPPAPVCKFDRPFRIVT